MSVVLYEHGDHRCLAFGDLVAGGSGVQANQFVIIDDGQSAILDPGGELTFTALTVELGRHLSLDKLTYLIASHQDPDIISSLQSWVTRTRATVVCSKLWSRFLPHLVPSYLGDRVGGNCLALPDEGMDIPLGRHVLKAIPAHFLHSVGNFHFYDPVSRILFSGDMGASMGAGGVETPVTDFDAHVPRMLGFHQRYMTGNRACRLWADMIRKLDVEMIVPQHGQPFAGAEMIGRFLDWISKLQCGVDLMTERDYAIP
ncbi:MBL fold metallo-hydrolase [Acidihalobacter yilgarnensis]|uniref:MBL fold metallo-hydrolase n=1 Tax=Acidihalobacter yilgarnensis TaxID=2819280 RepID=A0A1D8ISM9_9GAMM|nr:MBL fold metallo-hydrolase [Acidihalobacter yilgarnensis]AOU99510.1 MBL fold metallo-hydrolase [Acidihalobacter yilgarnensis]